MQHIWPKIWLLNSNQTLGIDFYDRKIKRINALVMKVSRTIADSAASETVLPEHISGAIQYKSLDRQLYAVLYLNAAYGIKYAEERFFYF